MLGKGCVFKSTVLLSAFLPFRQFHVQSWRKWKETFHEFSEEGGQTCVGKTLAKCMKSNYIY